MTVKSFKGLAPGLIPKNLLQTFFTNFHNKLKHLTLSSLSSLDSCLWVRPGAYPRVEHLKGLTHKHGKLERLARDKHRDNKSVLKLSVVMLTVVAP